MSGLFTGLPLPALVGIFGAAGLVVFVVSTRMTRLADLIADRAGWGEALIGGLMLGAATSLSGLAVSVSAAWSGDASLAFSNGVGGIAAQTAFLALADIAWRRANLEHASAEPANLFQCALLAILLALPILAYTSPEVSLLGLHPVSLVMFLVYAVGVRLTRRVSEAPMWQAVDTDDTRHDVPEDESEPERGAAGPLAAFALLAISLAVSGWIIAQVAGAVIERTGLSSSLVGALMTAVVTSLPELVTTVAAVRRGALQLAVGGIIGGNTFDSLFLVASDAAYRDGSIFHALEPQDYFWLATGSVMTAILLAGLILRERTGPGGIGLESSSILGLYVIAAGVQALAG
ncbi:sodium:calcium antiporter [Roseitranquillus sediminis]|uniref:sodium:calcium antiporter n=1 Tax=Roseitranquillus sediminis TaxID=2809051 RepID=UPI001D0C6C9B|nr:sodium:calcium antiporter [Roseitranquillus sediminis]MBM9593512.1 sodium:calcium antiporter [Roseitranquillus sediminis]